MKKSKKSLRGKLIKTIIKDFFLSKLFEQISESWRCELDKKLKDNLSFELEIIVFEVHNFSLSVEIFFDNGNEKSSIHASLCTSGSKIN